MKTWFHHVRISSSVVVVILDINPTIFSKKAAVLGTFPPGKFPPGKFPPIILPPGKSPLPPPKNSYPENPHRNIPTHFINFLSSHLALHQQVGKSVHVHPPWTKNFGISRIAYSFLMKLWQY